MDKYTNLKTNIERVIKKIQELEKKSESEKNNQIESGLKCARLLITDALLENRSSLRTKFTKIEKIPTNSAPDSPPLFTDEIIKRTSLNITKIIT